MSDCLFCKILAGELPCTKVYEDEKVLAFRDIHPKAPVHVLVVPEEHIQSVSALNEENVHWAASCLLAVDKIVQQEGLVNGYRVVSNCGKDAGQTVPHLHFHILGGKRMLFGLRK